MKALLFDDVLTKSAVSLLFLFVFLFFNFPFTVEDLWLILNDGKWIVEHQQLPYQDTYPFTAMSAPYLCVQWLARLFLYLLYGISGLFGLKVFHALFFVGVLGLFAVFSYKKVPLTLFIALALLLILGLAHRYALRADMFNFIFVPIFLIKLLEHQQTADRRKLFILPLLGILWANIHIGSLVYGGLMIAIFFFASLVRDRHLSRDLGLTLSFYGLVFFVTPYGLDGVAYLTKTFLSASEGIYKLAGITTEHQPPGYIFLSLNYAHFHILFFIGLFVLLRQKEKNFALVLLFIIAVFLFMCMARHSSFFVLTASITSVYLAQQSGLNLLWQKIFGIKILRILFLLVISLYLGLQSFHIVNAKSVFNGKENNNLSLDVDPFLPYAIESLISSGIHGKVFNSNGLGGPIIWFSDGKLKPFLNGMLLSYEEVNNAMAIFTKPHESWPMAERDYDFKVAILKWSSEWRMVEYLHQLDSWQLIAINGPLITFVRKDAFKLPEPLNDFKKNLESMQLTQDNIRTLKNLNERQDPQTIFSPRYTSVDLFTEGVALFQLGYKAAAVNNFIQGLKITQNPLIHHTVNVMLKKM